MIEQRFGRQRRRATAIQDRLANSKYADIRQVQCETAGDKVVLRGRVKSFFQKQMAQEAVRHGDGDVVVVNQIEVS